MTETQLHPKHAEILTHMLGAGPHVRKKMHGYRNRYCVDIGNDDHKLLIEMEEAGLVKSGQVINGGTGKYYFATIKGCAAIGLSKTAIKHAMEN